MPDYKKRVPSPLSETSRDKQIHASLRSENAKLMKQVEELKRSNEDKENIILIIKKLEIFFIQIMKFLIYLIQLKFLMIKLKK